MRSHRARQVSVTATMSAAAVSAITHNSDAIEA